MSEFKTIDCSGLKVGDKVKAFDGRAETTETVVEVTKTKVVLSNTYSYSLANGILFFKSFDGGYPGVERIISILQ